MPDLDQFAKQPQPPEQVADVKKSDAPIAAPASSKARSNKKIFVFCDGTGNEFAGRAEDKIIHHFWSRKPKIVRPDGNSNVVKLYTSLCLNESQIAYYHPGVGTMGDPTKKGVARLWSKIKGLAFGFGFQENVLDAYRYLMQHYSYGDTVYIIGFSRGAYTARALAGLLHGYGLLCRGNEGHLLYAWQMYKDGLKKARQDNQESSEKGHEMKTDFSFRDTFSHPDFIIHFMGLWDTVSSVGWITTPIRLLHLAQNASVVIGRHAVSIDERRCFYHDNLWGDPVDVQVPPVLQGEMRGEQLAGKQDILQVWFPGVHSDVGGSYPQIESGLANNALEWMMDEVKKAGAIFDPPRVQTVFGGPVTNDPKGLTAALQSIYLKPTSSEPHKSMKGGWWMLEIFPHRFYDRDGEKKEKLRIPWGGRRHLPDSSLLHPSVLQLLESKTYAPQNLAAGKITVLSPASQAALDLADTHGAKTQALPDYGLFTLRKSRTKEWRENAMLVLLVKIVLVTVPMLIVRRPMIWMGHRFKPHWMNVDCTTLCGAGVAEVHQGWASCVATFAEHAWFAVLWSLIAATVLVLVWEFVRKFILPRS
jgi:uncharacterized protein (DUF2235 family)